MQKRNPMFNKADTKITFDKDTMKIVSFFLLKFTCIIARKVVTLTNFSKQINSPEKTCFSHISFLATH